MQWSRMAWNKAKEAKTLRIIRFKRKIPIANNEWKSRGYIVSIFSLGENQLKGTNVFKSAVLA